MRQCFRSYPWVLPPDPEPIAQIFKRFGREFELARGKSFQHGGKFGSVYFLLEGLVTFSFVDVASRSHIFAVVLPGCALGDLDSLPTHAPDVIAECLTPCRGLSLPVPEYQAHLRESVQLMEAYAHLSIKKEEAIIEGAFANFTLDLETRLRLLLYSILRAGCKKDLQVVLETPEEYYRLPWSPSVTQISQIVSANRSWLSTKISEWISAGLIKREGRALLCRADLFAPLTQFKSSKL